MAAYAHLKNEFTEDEKCHNHEMAHFMVTVKILKIGTSKFIAVIIVEFEEHSFSV